MDELISRQDAIDVAMNDSLIINAMDSVKDGDIHRTKRAITRLLKSLPSAEPERKIIYCKDCKFYTPMNRILKTGICDMTMHHLGDDGFCSTAEKRGEK